MTKKPFKVPTLSHPFQSTTAAQSIHLFPDVSKTNMKFNSFRIGEKDPEYSVFTNAVVACLSEGNHVAQEMAVKLRTALRKIMTSVRIFAPPRSNNVLDYFFKSQSDKKQLLLYALVHHHELRRILSMLKEKHDVDLLHFQMQDSGSAECRNKACTHCVRPYACPFCFRSYAKKSKCTAHIRSKHSF